MKREVIRHEFVEFIPRELEEGVVYISVVYATAAHNCCCGCGNRVVTPLTPTDWKLTYDGESVWLAPSIGNWYFPCQSHYWIERNQISWDGRWSPDKIAAGRKRDKAAKQWQFAPRSVALTPAATPEAQELELNLPDGFWKDIGRRLRLLFGRE